MIVGIDLGTTNSLITVFRDGRCETIPNSLGELLTPSVVSIDDDGSILVGASARERLYTHPHLSVATFKRFMGSDRVTRLGDRSFRPEELSALILRSLKADAEAFLGTEVTEAIISVPAYFNDTQRKATRNAGAIAGLHVERILNEPTAAAIAYGLHQNYQEGSFLVLDLGGGTFDVSILEIFDGVMEVHAAAGDNFLGGEDFLQVLIDLFLDRQEPKVGYAQLDLNTQSRLRARAEVWKKDLSSQDSVTAQFPLKDTEVSTLLSRSEFERACEPLAARLRTPLENVLRDARIKPAELQDIVLVGGATRMPLIGKLVSRVFGRFPRRDIDPDLAVGLGAGLQGALKRRDKALEEIVLTDVCPYTLGVEAMVDTPSGWPQLVFSPIIERNWPIPTSRVQTYHIANEDQREVHIKVYQGESRIPENNIHLGTIDIKLPKKLPAGSPIDIRFSYDINGLLEVEVTILANNTTTRKIMSGTSGAMGQEEIEQSLAKLAALKIHPREQMVHRTLLARADRWFAQLTGLERTKVGEALDAYRGALDRQDPGEITVYRRNLVRLLALFDGSMLPEEGDVSKEP